MRKLIGLLPVIAGSLFALDYLSPVTPDSDLYLVKLFLWMILGFSTINFIVRLISLPFSKGK
jgi:hypothetical protein